MILINHTSEKFSLREAITALFFVDDLVLISKLKKEGNVVSALHMYTPLNRLRRIKLLDWLQMLLTLEQERINSIAAELRVTDLIEVSRAALKKLLTANQVSKLLATQVPMVIV